MRIYLAIAALGGVMTLGVGIMMMMRPQSYLGTGTPPARDPATVIWFGRMLTLFGAVPISIFLVSFFSE